MPGAVKRVDISRKKNGTGKLYRGLWLEDKLDVSAGLPVNVSLFPRCGMNQQLELVLQARLLANWVVVQGFEVWEDSSCVTFHATSRGDLPQNDPISILVCPGVQDSVLHMEVSHVYLAVHQDLQKCCDLGTFHSVAFSCIS